MHNLDVEEWLLSAVLSLYQGVSAIVKTVYVALKSVFRLKLAYITVPL